MMVDLDKPFSGLLRLQLANRRRETGYRFTTCRRMLPVLGPSPPATEEEMTWPPVETIVREPRETIIDTIIPGIIVEIERETIIEKPRETIIRRGRPRKGTERETISAAAPWTAAGLSRATWYRKMKSNV